MFNNGSEFKQYFTPLLKYFDVEHDLTKIKNPQANSPVERVHQVILSVLFTKDIDNRLFDHIDPWVETLASIAWAIRSSCHRNILYTSGQDVFCGYILLKIVSVID